jgi:iron(III) transport system ATP-binding protein
MVFQSYALWPHMDVQENVAYGLHERKLDSGLVHRRTARALDTVRMGQFRDRMPNQLSGGQQQRVALARALVIEPDVVLLDEPLSNLDAKLRLEMRREIKRIHRETGVTMVYVTHDQKEALSMADRIAVMSMGRVQQVGTPRQIYRRPTNRFVAEFIGEANFLPGTVQARNGQTGTIRTELGTFRAALSDGAPHAGEPAELMVRPEALRFGPEQANALSARVAGSIYLGEVEQFLLRTGEVELVALKDNPEAAGPEPGRQVELSFAPDDAVLLAPDRESP